MERHIDINKFDYPLSDERIAKFPLENRSDSKLMVYRNGAISESRFGRLAEALNLARNHWRQSCEEVDYVF